MAKNRTILITGASSGIGKGLALVYAKPGTTLLLTGRNQERLEAVQMLCQQQGAEVEITTIAVQDFRVFEAKLKDWDSVYAIDVVIANAGVSSDTSQAQSDHHQNVMEVINVNLNGVVNTVNPLLEGMKQRQGGQIVLISSMAGFRGLPNAVAYSVSKVGVTAYGDALRPLLKEEGISVTTIFPGFVKTRITDFNRFPMPGLMEVEEAAGTMKAAIDQKKAQYGFPWPIYYFSKLMSLLPTYIGDWILTLLPRKQ